MMAVIRRAGRTRGIRMTRRRRVAGVPEKYERPSSRFSAMLPGGRLVEVRILEPTRLPPAGFRRSDGFYAECGLVDAATRNPIGGVRAGLCGCGANAEAT